MGKIRTNSVRFPKARAKNAPAMKGRGRARVKYTPPTSPSKAKPRAICHAPANPRLHHVQVPKTEKSARRIRRLIDSILTLESRKKKKTHSPAINAVKKCAGNLRIHFACWKRANGTTLRTAPSGKTE